MECKDRNKEIKDTSIGSNIYVNLKLNIEGLGDLKKLSADDKFKIDTICTGKNIEIKLIKG